VDRTIWHPTTGVEVWCVNGEWADRVTAYEWMQIGRTCAVRCQARALSTAVSERLRGDLTGTELSVGVGGREVFRGRLTLWVMQEERVTLSAVNGDENGDTKE
jgi:hypothetical protein